MILGEPIILGGGGGIACVVIISTEAGATVTATLGNTSISKTANADGKAVFELKKAGVWTITASLNGETTSTEIDTNLALETELTFIDPILEKNTWENISKIAREGKATTLWNVGDTKSFVMDGVTYKAQIVDFDHYDVVNPTGYGRTKAGILFQFEKTPTNAYAMSDVQYPEGGYANVSLCSTISGFINSMESDLSNVIQEVTIPYSAKPNDGTASNMNAKLFLPSGYEIFGTKSSDRIAIGTRYAFYAAGNSPVKTDIATAIARQWWTRSLKMNSNDDYRVVTATGGGTTYVAPTNTNYIAPVFCV